MPPDRAPIPLAATQQRPYTFIDVESIEVRLSAGQARTRRAPGNLPQVGAGRYTHLDPARPLTQRYKFIDPQADEIRSNNKTIVVSDQDLLYPNLYDIDRFKPGYLLEVRRVLPPLVNRLPLLERFCLLFMGAGQTDEENLLTMRLSKESSLLSNMLEWCAHPLYLHD